MRILFVGGMYRGLRLAERLVERDEDVVGAFVFEEDQHETAKFADEIVSALSAKTENVKKTRRITREQLSEIRDRLAPDVIFCLGWRTMIPPDILACAPLGGVAVHDSLLPRLRGFAPTNWGLILGHDQLGATLFQLTDSVDAGQIYFQGSIAPARDETYESVQSRIAALSVDLFEQFLDASNAGTLSPHIQNEADATYTCARAPVDGEIDWKRPSQEIERLIRALAPPAPGAFTYLGGEPLVITQAAAVDHPRNYEGRIPGRVVDRDIRSGTIDVLCGNGILRIERVCTCEGGDVQATAVVRSVRESLGLNHSAEIISLRERLERLESLVAEQQPPIALKHTA